MGEYFDGGCSAGFHNLLRERVLTPPYVSCMATHVLEITERGVVLSGFHNLMGKKVFTWCCQWDSSNLMTKANDHHYKVCPSQWELHYVARTIPL